MAPIWQPYDIRWCCLTAAPAEPSPAPACKPCCTRYAVHATCYPLSPFFFRLRPTKKRKQPHTSPQSLEAKHNVPTQPLSSTHASVSLQALIRMYSHVSGMTVRCCLHTASRNMHHTPSARAQYAVCMCTLRRLQQPPSGHGIPCSSRARHALWPLCRTHPPQPPTAAR